MLQREDCLMIAGIFDAVDIDHFFIGLLQQHLQLFYLQIAVHNQHFLNQHLTLLLLFGFILLYLLEIPFYLVDLLLHVWIFSGKSLYELEKVRSSDDSVVVLIKDGEDPEVDELQVAVGCVLDEVAELSQAEGLWKSEEMEKSLQKFAVYLSFVFVDDVLSCDFELINELIAADRSYPFLEGLSEHLLIHLQFLGVVDLSLGFHVHQLLVLFFEQKGQLLRVVSFLGFGTMKLLVVPTLAVSAQVQRVVKTQGGLSGCEVVVYSLMGAALAGPAVGLELRAMNGFDVVGTLHRQDILLLQQTTEEPLSDNGMKYLIDLFLLLDVLGLLHLALRQLLMRLIVIHSNSLPTRIIYFTPPLPLANSHQQYNYHCYHCNPLPSSYLPISYDDLNNNKMRFRLLSVVMLLLALAVSVESVSLRSALRLCDSTDCDIDLLYINGVYNLSIPNNYLKTATSTSFCYRQRTVANSTNGTCDLVGYDQSYQCYSIDSTTISSPKLYKYTANAALIPTNTTKTLVSTLAPSATTTSLNLTNIITNSIYQFVMGTVYNLATDTGSKLVFFQSFPPLGTIDQSSNIFMQRYFVCFQYYVGTNYNYNLVFYGGVVRHGVDTMYIGFVTFLSSEGGTVATTNTLNLWGGLDFSTSHSSRDMIGFSSGFGYLYDLYSLYGSAPYNDTATNINGTMDLIVSFTSNTGASALSYSAAIGGYRLYDTGDAIGDEILRKKINFNWCYAVAYSTSTTPIQPTDKIKHNFVNCWIPNVVVWESTLVLGMLLLFVLMASLA